MRRSICMYDFSHVRQKNEKLERERLWPILKHQPDIRVNLEGLRKTIRGLRPNTYVPNHITLHYLLRIGSM
jgi:hypothetical protein